MEKKRKSVRTLLIVLLCVLLAFGMSVSLSPIIWNDRQRRAIEAFSADEKTLATNIPEAYQLVFFDDFSDTVLNTDMWAYRLNGQRRGGYNSNKQVRVEDGNLILTAEYLTDGEFGKGWYSGMVCLKQLYTRGYFEIRCKVNDGGGFWSAFWLQSAYSYIPEQSKGGVGGAEIDIMEAIYSEFLPLRNCVKHTVFCSGRGGSTSTRLNKMRGQIFAGADIYNEYNTYGLLWTETEYIFYINGIKTCSSSFADGVSTVDEQVIVSLEIPDEIKHDTDFSTSFTVDYVKIYQLPK